MSTEQDEKEVREYLQQACKRMQFSIGGREPMMGDIKDAYLSALAAERGRNEKLYEVIAALRAENERLTSKIKVLKIQVK
jgi:hypothetical protein